MRKLTVKNFSVIKDAELDFGKITVLIGPQGHGKSLLCKLAYFLSKEIIEEAVAYIARGKTFAEFKLAITGIFLKRFETGSISQKSYLVELTVGNYTVKFFGGNETRDGEIGCDFSREFVELYAELRAKHAQSGQIFGTQDTSSEFTIWAELNLLLTNPVIVRTIFIPAGRSFFTSTSLGFNALQNPDIDPLIRKFPAEISWDATWKGVGATHGDKSLCEISEMMDEIAGGQVQGSERAPIFVANDGRRVPFTLLSSGTQELLPLFNVLGRIASIVQFPAATLTSRVGLGIGRWEVRSKNLVYLEEPEAHIFPDTQYQLVQLFAWLSNEPTQDFSWVITTHSPYILTAFNTLIEAWRVGNKEGKREQVAAIIPEKYWINENDFAAYSINDGVLTPIFSKEQEGKEGSGLIDGDFLDSVSDQLGGEFDKLLDIEYAN